MLKACLDSVDVTDLQFKLQCRLKIFENNDVSTFPNANSLLSCASRYGLLFVGTNSKFFQVIQTQKLHSYTPKDKDVTEYSRRNIDLPSSPKHLCVNCDSTIIAVVVERNQCAVVIFYDVLSFFMQNTRIIKEIRLSSTPNVYVREINWNPSLPAVFTACKSDGTLGVYELKGDSVDFNELPAASGATCFCWSPKGKQIAVGSKDGKITQYKPDLKAVKVIYEPQFGDPHMLISLQWVSNYQFIGVYQSVQQEGSSSVVVVDAPKTGEPSYTNFDDICYSGSSRSSQFYLILQQNWNFLMVASANSSEVGVLGSSGDSWTQWMMSDTARAELPLSPDHQETLPVGLTFDVSSTTPLPWGESSIPPCPLLCMLSHQGVLCCFNVVYLKEGVPTVCAPPDTVQDTSGLSTFITTSGNVPESAQFKPAQPAPAYAQFGMGQSPQTIIPPISKGALLSAPKVTVQFTPSIQSTPLLTGKMATDLTSKNLFSGQATLTPIKPQQPSQGATLFGGQTLITPISKGPNVSASITSSIVTQATNVGSEKYASIFASLNPTTLPLASTVPVKPIVISATAPAPKFAATAPKLTATVQPSEVIEDTASKVQPNQVTSFKQESQIVDPKLKAETRAMLSQMIRDEWMYLEAELKVLLNQGRSLKISLGTDEEKVEMITHLESLQAFVNEAVDISVGQSSEIHCLKQNIIQSWAWFEEANSYYNSSKNEAVALLLKLQPLDSVSQKRLKDIEQLTYYIESQLQQTSKTLDEQWGNFQDYAKKTHRVQMPTMEAIFQTMVRQSAILQRQTYILKDIAMRLRKKTFGVSSLLLSLDKAENLADDLKELRLDANDILQLQYEKLKNHTKILSNKKANMLRSLLKQREVTHVTAVRPQLSAWTINQSPVSKMRQSISILGTHMTPVSKSPVAKSLNFVQSSPLKVSDISKTIQVNQGLTFSLGSPSSDKSSYLISSNASPAPSGFVSLAKSRPGISNSQGSAFAPTGFAATSSTASENQIFSKTNLSTVPFSFSGTPTSKIVSSSGEIKPSFSSSPLFNTASVVGTPIISGQSVHLASSSSSIFKPTSDTTSVKHQSTTTTTSFAFSFGSNNSSAKGIFGAASATTSSVTGSNTLFFSSSPSSNSSFLTSSSTEANSSNTQVIKPTSVTATIIPNVGIKPVQISSSSSIFGSQQSSFAPLSKSPSVTTIPTAVSTSTPSKAPSGGSSIFANLQSVIDKATGSTGATTAIKPLKLTSVFGVSTGAITTTTQSLFESVSSTATTKPVFETTTLSSTGGIFGSVNKPVEAFKSTPNTPNIFSTSSIMTQPSKQETLIPSSGTPSSHDSMKPLETAKESSLVSTSPEIASKPLSVISSSVSADGADVKREPSLPNTTQISIFGLQPTSSPSNTSAFLGATTTSTTPSIFSSTAATTIPKSGVNIFGAGVTTSLTAGSGTTTSIFGSSKTASLIAPSVSETTSQSTPIFGNANVSTAVALNTTDSNIFGASTPTSTPSSNLFASGNTGSIFGSSGVAAAVEPKAFETATSASVFGTPPSNKNIFGAPATTSSGSFPTTTAVSAFGTSPTSSNIFSSSGSIFGGNTMTPANNIFGTPTTTNTNVFGTPTSTPSTNIFASALAASTTQNVFGSTTSNAAPSFGTQSGSIFGTPKTTETVFGQPNVFGSQATTESSIFGQPATFGSGTADFGSSTTTTSGNIFGSVVSSSSEFGSGFSTVSSPNTFGSQATTQSQPTGSFGFGSLNVGGTSSSGSIFGSNSNGAFAATATANPFGKVEVKAPFGSSGASIFGNSPSGVAASNIFASPTTTASSVFGSSGETTFGANNTGGAFGSPNTFGSSAFGQKPAFGQTSAFGSNTFGSPQSGSFSGGGTSPIAQTGFGAPAAFQKPSGFGSSPVFGGSPNPAFGAAPSFGGAPAFGNAPAFGSPDKVFGGAPAASGGFGAAATQQSAGFGNLASQNTIGFGNLAQQASTPASSPFSSGNSSFSSWR